MITKVKVLQCENWMLSEDLSDERLTEIDPVFHRNGLYKTYDLCWFECDGKAYLYNVNQFVYNLETIAASELNQKQAMALKGVIDQNLATKTQRKLYSRHIDFYGTRNVYRSAVMTRKRILGR